MGHCVAISYRQTLITINAPWIIFQLSAFFAFDLRELFFGVAS